MCVVVLEREGERLERNADILSVTANINVQVCLCECVCVCVCVRVCVCVHYMQAGIWSCEGMSAGKRRIENKRRGIKERRGEGR